LERTGWITPGQNSIVESVGDVQNRWRNRSVEGDSLGARTARGPPPGSGAADVALVACGLQA